MKTKHRKSGVAAVVELLVIVAIAVGLAIAIQAFVVKPYRIPSPSMEPTLDIGQRILVNRLSVDFGDPQVGDIVVFHPPKGAEDNVCGVRHQPAQPCPRPTRDPSDQNFIKRVVAGPGQLVAIRDGHVYLDGRRQSEQFIRPCEGDEACNFPRAIRVPRGYFFMMGDNRGDSADSRFWGPVPKDWIIGDAFATYWPPDRIGLL